MEKKDIKQFITFSGIIIGEEADNTNGVITLAKPLRMMPQKTDMIFNRLLANESWVKIPSGMSIEVEVTKEIAAAYAQAASQAYSGIILPEASRSNIIL